jgi:hypothetical protein
MPPNVILKPNGYVYQATRSLRAVGAFAVCYRFLTGTCVKLLKKATLYFFFKKKGEHLHGTLDHAWADLGSNLRGGKTC